MKIYFAGSIRGGRSFAGEYERIVARLRSYGTVLTEHVADLEQDDRGGTLSDREIYERDCRWLEEADIVIAEVTQPSLGVGYEIALGLSLAKPVVCLYKKGIGSLSAMIRGNEDIEIIAYTGVDELFVELEKRLA